MTTFTVQKVSDKKIIANRVVLADTAVSRMVGLLNRKTLKEGEGLIITQCRSIHMFFMKFPIDVIFIDKSGCVVGCVENIKPFQLSKIYFCADRAIELSSGVIAKSNVQLKDKIEIVQNKS